MKPCKIWNGAKNSRGYGQTSFNGMYGMLVHRVVFYKKHGYWPEIVMHKCDVRLCYEITHLRAGTAKENSEDMVRKGRSLKGMKQPNAILTNRAVRAIRGKMTTREAALKYGISQRHARRVKYGYRWGHI